MGRPRAFDDEKALEAAAHRFWASGYEATSIRDLSDSMGIAGTSLYNAYGGKRALFAAALDHYCNRSMRERIRRVESSASGIAALEAFFDDIIEKSIADCDKKGCFLINAALEIGASDPELSIVISCYLAELTGFFRRNIIAAQASTDELSEICADRYATHLLCVLIGVRVLARSSRERALLEAAAHPALQRFRHSHIEQLGGSR